ncbi:uncharacterized protein B0H18DRAFT_1120829 [Fomitopsis serialis]|uniref:uncharacterized protein n=1 Tax=Fomitopsis serialis TaxID=139415 RepID=UPI0020076F9E|nr:uncharacterized protein B0H18DRAFT_1120829 [Neoantrodia serialis]KAH9922657.1 hypothetical protein B0H18DRAFT_1120829 [Neoantrodia serialis]
MAFQTLNLDVVESILSHIAPLEALPLMTTCRALHVPATRRFLSAVEICWDGYLECHDHAQFCDYMLADPQPRAQCLRELTLSLILEPDISHPSGMPLQDRLAEIVRHATALRKIFLLTANDTFTQSCPALVDAIAEAKSLKVIHFLHVDLSGIALLSRMKSQLVSVTCKMDRGAATTVTQVQKPMRFLRNFVECLTKVTLNEALDVLIADANPKGVWPRVQELVLGDGEIRPEHWRPVCRAFPNIRTLRVRAASVDVTGAHAEWPKLDLVQTRSPLPLQCHVRNVKVDDGNDEEPLPGNNHDAAQYFEMLRRVSPVTLTYYHDRKLHAESIANVAL